MTKLLISAGALALAAIAVADPARARGPNNFNQCIHMCTLSGGWYAGCARSCGPAPVINKRAATARPIGPIIPPGHSTGPTRPTLPNPTQRH